MRKSELFLTALVAVTVTATAATGAASPRAVTLRVSCSLHGVAGASDTGALQEKVCQDYVGWFDGKLEWLVGGVVQYTEAGPLHGLDGGTEPGAIEIYADGSGNAQDFANIYDDPRSSVLAMPGLSVRVWGRKDARKPYALIADQPYTPVASALWSQHCGDCIQLADDITRLDGQVSQLQSQVQQLRDQLGGGSGFVTLDGPQTITGQKTFTAVILGVISTAVDFIGFLGGDVTGTQHATTVRGLQGVLVAATPPTDGQALIYNGLAHQWEPRLVCQGIRLDCNANPADGCETNILKDTSHCGDCSTACPGGANAFPTCERGDCVLSCNYGFSNCNNNPADGCETDTSHDNNNCGMCGVACPPNSTCNFGGCLSNCEPGQTSCNGVCVDIMGDNSNCGGCGLQCGPGAMCVNGACVMMPTCNDAIRNGMETDVDCGGPDCARCSDGHSCAAGSDCQNLVCQNGLCGCQAGFIACMGFCYDPDTDPSNCGGCGNTCPHGHFCSNGICVP